MFQLHNNYIQGKNHFRHPPLVPSPYSQVNEQDAAAGIAWVLAVPNNANSTIVLPETPYLSFVASPSILQSSSSPTLAANITFGGVFEDNGGALGFDGMNITLDTTPPEVDAELGVNIWGADNDTYFAGDELYVRVW